jgi:hypothetical protein
MAFMDDGRCQVVAFTYQKLFRLLQRNKIFYYVARWCHAQIEPTGDSIAKMVAALRTIAPG